MTRRASFTHRLTSGARLMGTFQKFPAHQTVELLGQTSLDFVVLDTEHAPFDPSQIDASILASHAVDLPLLVRVPRNEPDVILSVLDMGATGIFVPHVTTIEDAENAVAASRYFGGRRGFSPSTRAGGYGRRGLREYMEAADREVAVVLQIEDACALKSIEGIASVRAVAGLFVGRADLAVSMDADWTDTRLDDATWRTAAAARDAGIAAGAYLGDLTRAAEFLDRGVSFFVAGSDQGALKGEVNRLASTFHSIATAKPQGQSE